MILFQAAIFVTPFFLLLAKKRKKEHWETSAK
jgi:hypothetical protein